jgi:hypothetical protein
MTTESRPAPECRKNRGNRAGTAPSVVRDERGAILVLGIFMCACMVGALWYLAGIGSAIVYRERMQEGVDAVAFSGAVLHARGMNLIVLINLVMAAILAIRVAMRVTQLALVVVGTVLSLIPGLGTGLAAPFFTFAGKMETPIKTVRPFIDEGLKGLSFVQRAIARVVPPASLYGSFMVGERYKPVIETSLAGSPLAVKDGLPITEDTEDRLCEKAGQAVGSVMTMAVPGLPDDLASGISGSIGKMVKAGGAYFCEMGNGGGPPDISDDLNKGAEDACDEERKKRVKEANEARQAYDDACLRYNCAFGTPTETEQTELDQLAAVRDQKQQLVDDFDWDQCVEEKRQEAKKTFNEKAGAAEPQESKNGQGMTPKRVKDDWQNGIRDAQVIAVATGNTDSLRAGETGSRAGAWKTPLTFRVPTSARFALAQAEFFYDCDGTWGSEQCNGGGETMWRFRWRARLRRYNAPFEGVTEITNVLAGAEALSSLVSGAGSLGFQNADLYFELTQVVTRRDFIIH